MTADFWPRGIPCIPQLEGREFTITEKGPFSFEIDLDTSACGTFVSGYVNQVCMYVVCSTALNDVEMTITSP